MSSNAVRWSVVKGDAFDRILSFKNPDGTQMDLAGTSFLGQIRNTDSDALIASFTMTVDSPTTLGTVQVSLAPATTGAIGVGTYSFDVKRDPPSGKRKTLFAGEFKVYRTITHA
jgi:hypothetical protein